MTEKHHLTCDNILENLNAYIDGELDDEFCADFESHVQSCPECQIVINTLNKTIQLCKLTDAETSLPSETRHRLYARLNLEDYDKKD